MMQPRIALVDFDGVVLTNPVHSKRIVRKADAFVRSHLGSLNNELYSSYGHTMIGLNKLLPHISLDDFNKAIYDDSIATPFLPEEHTRWKNFVAQMHERNIPIYIFSNAPREWCEQFIDTRDIAGFVGAGATGGIVWLKPYPQIYRKIEYLFPTQDLLFWDDKFINFKPCLQDARWKKILVNENALTHERITPSLSIAPRLELF